MRDARRAAARRGLPRRSGSPRSTRCRARLLRREAPAIGLSRDFVIYDSSDQLAVVKQAMKALDIDDKMIQPRAALSRISQAKNRMEDAGRRCASTGWSLRDQQISRVYEAYLRALDRRRRARFRRPAAEDRRARSRTSERVRELLRAQVQVRARRRIPGHEPAAVPADPAPGRSASQSLRRRRSRSVDLPVARRGPAQHPRLRARLSRRHDREARAELPLDAGDSRRGLGRHQPEPQSQGQAALDRPAGRRRGSLYVRAGDEIEEADFITRGDPRDAARSSRDAHDGRAVPHQRAVARDRRRADARGRRRTASSAASGSTSARKSRTRSPTCACSSTRTTTSASGGW